MKRLLLSFLTVSTFSTVSAQVTITANDMPVNGDTLRYSTTLGVNLGFLLTDTGANKTWNLDTLSSLTQRVDEYKSALQVNPIYVLISPTAYGYKVADTFGMQGVPLPIAITEVYTFFSKKTGPARFVAEGFAAKVSGVPTPAVYSNEDEQYFFPLNYGNPEDSTDFKLSVSLATVGSMKQQGYRKTRVDAWGSITTPYFTTPKNCLRIRTEINEIDSVTISPLPAVGIPRRSVDYKWLVPGEHYPALWITANIVGGNETITTVRYRDAYKPSAIQEAGNKATLTVLRAIPNPATQNIRIQLPVVSGEYVVEVFDMQGRLLATQKNDATLDIVALPAGSYIARVSYEQSVGYASFIKK